MNIIKCSSGMDDSYYSHWQSAYLLDSLSTGHSGIAIGRDAVKKFIVQGKCPDTPCSYHILNSLHFHNHASCPFALLTCSYYFFSSHHLHFPNLPSVLLFRRFSSYVYHLSHASFCFPLPNEALHYLIKVPLVHHTPQLFLILLNIIPLPVVLLFLLLILVKIFLVFLFLLAVLAE